MGSFGKKRLKIRVRKTEQDGGEAGPSRVEYAEEVLWGESVLAARGKAQAGGFFI